MNLVERLDTWLVGGLMFAIILGGVSTAALFPTRGLYAFFGFVTIDRLSFHNYDVILYPLFTIAVIRPIWGRKSFAALLLVWGVNELTFDALYAPGYAVIATYAANQVYVAATALFIVVGVGVLRPKLALTVETLAWPTLLAWWVMSGEPLIFAPNVPGATVANWPWEVGYQLALFLTFITTVKPHEPAPG